MYITVNILTYIAYGQGSLLPLSYIDRKGKTRNNYVVRKPSCVSKTTTTLARIGHANHSTYNTIAVWSPHRPICASGGPNVGATTESSASNGISFEECKTCSCHLVAKVSALEQLAKYITVIIVISRPTTTLPVSANNLLNELCARSTVAPQRQHRTTTIALLYMAD
jgi:hypothetical protein